MGEVTELFVDSGGEGFAAGYWIVQPPVGGAIDLEVTHAIDFAFVVHVEMSAEDGGDGSGTVLLSSFDDGADLGAVFETVVVICIEGLVDEQEGG